MEMRKEIANIINYSLMRMQRKNIALVMNVKLLFSLNASLNIIISNCQKYCRFKIKNLLCLKEKLNLMHLVSI